MIDLKEREIFDSWKHLNLMWIIIDEGLRILNRRFPSFSFPWGGWARSQEQRSLRRSPWWQLMRLLWLSWQLQFCRTCIDQAILPNRISSQPQSEECCWSCTIATHNQELRAYCDKFLVLGIFAVFSQDGKEGFLAVESLADFVQSFHETYGHDHERRNMAKSLPLLARDFLITCLIATGKLSAFSSSTTSATTGWALLKVAQGGYRYLTRRLTYLIRKGRN